LAVECRADGHRPHCFAAGRDQKCLGYDLMDPNASPVGRDLRG
jgi:hypothetical protein